MIEPYTKTTMVKRGGGGSSVVGEQGRAVGPVGELQVVSRWMRWGSANAGEQVSGSSGYSSKQEQTSSIPEGDNAKEQIGSRPKGGDTGELIVILFFSLYFPPNLSEIILKKRIIFFSFFLPSKKKRVKATKKKFPSPFPSSEILYKQGNWVWLSMSILIFGLRILLLILWLFFRFINKLYQLVLRGWKIENWGSRVTALSHDKCNCPRGEFRPHRIQQGQQIIL